MGRKNSYDIALPSEAQLNRPANAPALLEYRAEIEWREGIPYLTKAPTRISEQPENNLRLLLRRCLDLPYDGLNPALAGLSQGEAMMVQLMRQAADGDSDARTQIIDRILGRPQQNIKSLNLSGDINEFLDRVAADTHIETIEVTPETFDPLSVEDI